METCQTCGGTQGLSAMEGVGGTIQRGEERHISFWKALLTAPKFPKGCIPQPSRPQKNSRYTGAGWWTLSMAACLCTPSLAGSPSICSEYEAMPLCVPRRSLNFWPASCFPRTPGMQLWSLQNPGEGPLLVARLSPPLIAFMNGSRDWTESRKDSTVCVIILWKIQGLLPSIQSLIELKTLTACTHALLGCLLSLT